MRKALLSWFPFLVTTLEWYEFSIYNSVMFYIGDIFHLNSKVGLLVLSFSFLFRPIGALIFSMIKNKLLSLTLSLCMMLIGTLILALAPMQNGVLWICCAKIIQALSIGGSYGINYFFVYEEEQNKSFDKKQLNYKIAHLQTGWLYGMIFGGITVMMCKIIIGNEEQIAEIFSSDCSFINKIFDLFSLKLSYNFLSFGWRAPFIISALFGLILIILSGFFKLQSNINQAPKLKHTTSFIHIIIIFMVTLIEMIIFYVYYAYIPCINEKCATDVVLCSILSNMHKIILIPLFLFFGHLLDKIANIFKRNVNSFAILLVCGLLMISSWVVDIRFNESSLYLYLLFLILTALITALCYASLIPWVLMHLKDSYIGIVFNMAAAFGGFIPYIFDAINMDKRLLMFSMALVPTIGILLHIIFFERKSQQGVL